VDQGDTGRTVSDWYGESTWTPEPGIRVQHLRLYFTAQLSVKSDGLGKWSALNESLAWPDIHQLLTAGAWPGTAEL
jgi:hypothetical protein